MLPVVLCAAAVLAPVSALAQKPTLTPADYARWESFGSTELSPDGAWIAYVITRVDGDDELRIREIAADTTRIVPFATRPLFSGDGRRLAWSIGVSEAERERLRQSNQPFRSGLGILDLHTGETTEVAGITSFAFSADGRHIAMRAYAAPGTTGAGADVIVRDLVTGVDLNFGNVDAFEWQDRGPLLAMTIAAANRAGNGVRIYDPRVGTVRTLDSDTADYTGLVWRRDAGDLAVLRRWNAGGYDDPNHVLLAWRGLDGRRATAHVLDPAVHEGFPRDLRIFESRELRWSEDGATLFFGTRQWLPAPPAAADGDSTAPSRRIDPPNVEVWHSADVEIIPEQKSNVSLAHTRSMITAWHLADDRVVRIATDLAEDVTLSGGRFVLLTDARPHERERMFGPAYRDLYTVDITTGERRRFAERVQFQYGPSTTGRFMLYVRDGHYWTYDTRTGRHTSITRDVPTSFINIDHDHTVPEKPPFGTGGWTLGEESVLLHDRYDIWEVRADGSGATNLTNGAADRVRHRRVWLTIDHRVVDMKQPVYVMLYGDRSKRSGYGVVRRGEPVDRLVWVDSSVTRLGRARDADVYYYRVEAADVSPDWYVGGPRLNDARRVTATNPFQQEYAWTRSELLDYRSTNGDELQAALFYPADWQPGRTYPLLIYFYEVTSNTLHNYTVPSEYDAYNTTVFTHNGYFVLRPDIVYRPRNPGLSAVDALLPALDRVLETGMVDAGRVGLIGHSWGAYQTAFTITQTDRFSAAVAGAPLANLISMYLSIFWNTGTTDARIFEIDQGRMEVPFWDDLDAYMNNSPIFSIRSMDTPLLVAFGTRDGAVDWHQGIELYNAARRAGKDMVMLVYENESHSLVNRGNQVDYHRRIMQWLAHYLKGEPPAPWITDGVRYRDR